MYCPRPLILINDKRNSAAFHFGHASGRISKAEPGEAVKTALKCCTCYVINPVVRCVEYVNRFNFEENTISSHKALKQPMRQPFLPLFNVFGSALDDWRLHLRHSELVK